MMKVFVVAALLAVSVAQDCQLGYVAGTVDAPSTTCPDGCDLTPAVAGAADCSAYVAGTFEDPSTTCPNGCDFTPAADASGTETCVATPTPEMCALAATATAVAADPADPAPTTTTVDPADPATTTVDPADPATTTTTAPPNPTPATTTTTSPADPAPATTTTTAPTVEAQPATTPTAADPTMDSGMAGAAAGGAAQGVTAVYMQQQYSATYATALLEVQAGYVWYQAAEGMEKMAIVSAGAGGFADPVFGLEEEASNIEKMAKSGKSAEHMAFLEVEEVIRGVTDDVGSMDDLIEAQTESSLLQLVKLMYVQAAHRLGSTQERHYQIKMVTGQLAPLATGSEQLSQVMYLLYYRDMVELVTTTVTIQKQDSWNFWVFNEMLETQLFQESELPQTFMQRLAASRLQAMGQFQMQAQLELVGLVMDMYLQQLVGGMSMQMQQSGMVNMMQTAGGEQMGSSFLETETQFVPSMALGGLFGWEQFMPYVKFYTAWVKYQASSQLAMIAQIDALALVGKDGGQADKTPAMMAHQVMPLLKSWTQLRLMLALYDFYQLTGAMGGGLAATMAATGPFHANAHAHASASASMSNLMQEDAAVTAPVDVLAEPTKDAVVESVAAVVADEPPAKLSSVQVETAAPVAISKEDPEPSVVG